MEITSTIESVIVHYKDNKRCAATFFNGHADTHKLEEPMGRKDYEDLFEVNKLQSS